MPRLLFPILAATLLLGDGLLFGLWTNRWQDSRQLAEAVAGLERVPLTIGAWRGQPLRPLDERACAMAGFAGYLHRGYVNPLTGTSLSVLLACGPFGPISVHTPDVCFSESGFVQQGKTAPVTEELGKPVGAAHFWTAEFAKPEGIGAAHVRVYWTWTVEGSWQTPNNPRWTFAGVPALYKLYVVQDVAGEDERRAEDECRAFLRALLPELDRCLAFNQ